jgi:hypothetical protein
MTIHNIAASQCVPLTSLLSLGLFSAYLVDDQVEAQGLSLRWGEALKKGFPQYWQDRLLQLTKTPLRHGADTSGRLRDNTPIENHLETLAAVESGRSTL